MFANCINSTTAAYRRARTARLPFTGIVIAAPVTFFRVVFYSFLIIIGRCSTLSSSHTSQYPTLFAATTVTTRQEQETLVVCSDHPGTLSRHSLF